MKELAHEASILHELRSPYVPVLLALHIHEEQRPAANAFAYMAMEFANPWKTVESVPNRMRNVFDHRIHRPGTVAIKSV